MDAVQAQQQLIDAGVAVEGGGGVEMMVMESLDPTLLQMKTEVNDRSDVTHDRPRVRLSSFFAQNVCHGSGLIDLLWF